MLPKTIHENVESFRLQVTCSSFTMWRFKLFASNGSEIRINVVRDIDP